MLGLVEFFIKNWKIQIETLFCVFLGNLFIVFAIHPDSSKSKNENFCKNKNRKLDEKSLELVVI